LLRRRSRAAGPAAAERLAPPFKLRARDPLAADDDDDE
jgi:hypothetical protein